jgi:hypothetical protein
MITHFETNKVFISKGLASSCKYSRVAYGLLTAFDNCDVCWEYIPHTESDLHIWARDFMPVQVSKDKFICFCYNPDYLKDFPEYIPHMDEVLGSLDISVEFSKIIIDGGNIISCGDKVLMTEKILIENPTYHKRELLDELSRLFEAEIVLIPWDKYEEYGHSDGMVRYMGHNRVLINNYCDFDRHLRKRLVDTLKHHFEIEELHYGKYTPNSWAYINFLHLGEHIFIPALNEENDYKALSQIQAAFPMCKCHAIPYSSELVIDGGVLNCATWNIQSNSARPNNNDIICP